MSSFAVFSRRRCSRLARSLRPIGRACNSRGGLFAVLVAALSACAAPTPLTDDEKRDLVERMSDEIERDFPGVEIITAEELLRVRDSGEVVLVDAREEEEREVSWIPGAISAAAFEREPDSYADNTVVVYCTIGYRSSEYAKRMASLGHRVVNLRGSLLAWVHAGGPVVGPGGEPTTELHVYGRPWDLAPARYETTW